MKYLIIIAFGIMAYTNTYAQDACWNQVHTISTDPNHPQSTNTWDWTAKDNIAYLISTGMDGNGNTIGTPISMPMWANGPTNNLNVLDYQQVADPLEKDHLPADGWELLSYYFGQANVPFNIGAVEWPYYIIYNRYLGKLRIYLMANKQQSTPYPAINIHLNFVGRNTALLQQADAIAQPVETFNPTNNYLVANYPNQDANYWYMAEYQTAYDPCTCELQENSNINIEIRELATYELLATISGTSIGTLDAVKSNGSTAAPGSTTKNDVLGDINDLNKKALNYYKQYSAASGNIDKVLEGTDKLYQHYWDNKIANLNGALQGVNTNLGTTVTQISKSSEGVKQLMGSSDFAKISKSLKSITKTIPYVGAAFGVLDFVLNFGKKTETPASKTTLAPHLISTNYNLKLNGSLSLPKLIKNFVTQTPGSAPNPTGSVEYNNILGTVNVLKTPKLEYQAFIPSNNLYLSDGSDYLNGPGNDGKSDPIYYGQYNLLQNLEIRQFRPQENLKYLLNPSANLEIMAIDVALVLEFNNENPLYVAGSKTKLWQYTPAFIQESSDAQTMFDNINKSGWQVEYLSKDYFASANTAPDGRLIKIRTPYVPIQCFQNQVINLQYSSVANNKPKMYYKLIYTLKKKDVASDDFINVVVQYETKDKFDNAQRLSEHENQLKYSNLVQVGHYIDTFFDHTFTIPLYQNSFVYNFEHSIISASAQQWPTSLNPAENLLLQNIHIDKDIFVNGTMQIDNGVTLADGVTLYASKAIETLPNVDFEMNNPFNALVIEDYMCSPTTLGQPVEDFHESDADIKTVCNSEGYKSRASFKIGVEQNPIKPTINSVDQITLYPNPATKLVNIAKPADNIINKTTVLDITGKQLFTLNGNINSLDVSNLMAGIYVIQMVLEDGTSVSNKLQIVR